MEWIKLNIPSALIFPHIDIFVTDINNEILNMKILPCTVKSLTFA